MLPNRREHDHIGQFKQMIDKAGIRIGKAQTETIVKNLANLAVAGASTAKLDDLVQKIVKDSKFRESFIKDYRGSVQNLKIFDTTPGKG